MSWLRPHAVAISASLGAIAVVTLLIYALRPVAPVVSLGSLYTLAVLPVAILWGIRYAIGVSVASMVLFNFLFLPPVHTFALEDSRNWGALAVFLVTGVVVGELAARSRRRGVAALEAESLRRSDAIKTAVIQAVSHDLRTPLATIEAAVGGLESGVLELSPDDRAGLLETIRLESTRLTRLVENLLDLSRLQAGAAEPRPELWTADQLLVQALDELPDSDRVRVELPDELPLVRVDADQIQRVLVNLIENALKFSPPESEVAVEAFEEDGRLVFRVVDCGSGVPEGEAKRIFAPFQRGGAGRGTGLGLAIASGFAEANGGQLTLESSSAGTSFALVLHGVELPARVGA